VQPVVGGEAAQFVAQQPADPALQLGETSSCVVPLRTVLCPVWRDSVMFRGCAFVG
jgi:hypothetical protein